MALYMSVTFYILSGIFSLLTYMLVAKISLYGGTIIFFIAIIMLNIYAFRAVDIRKVQFEHSH